LSIIFSISPHFAHILQSIFLFSSNLSCIFYRPLTALPFFCGTASPFPLFFQSFLAKQQEKPGKFPLNVPWFCAKFTLSIKYFLKTRINSFCLALAFPVPIFLSARPAAAFLQKSAP